MLPWKCPTTEFTYYRYHQTGTEDYHVILQTQIDSIHLFPHKSAKIILSIKGSEYLLNKKTQNITFTE